MVIGKQIVAEQPTDTERYGELLFRKARPELVNRLVRLGVNLEKTALVRLEEGIGYRIGDAEGSHVILDKPTFLPLRFRLVSTPENGVAKGLEFRYQDWSKFGRSEIPGHVEVHDVEGILQVVDVREVKIGAKVDAGLFDLDALRRRYPGSLVNSVDAEDTRRMDELKESIERFRKRFEE